MKRILFILIFLSWLVVNLFFVNAQPPDNIETIKKAVVKIRTYDNEGQFQEEGTGFVVGTEDGSVFILTAYHVVKDSNKWEVKFYQKKRKSFEAQIFERFNAHLDIGIVIVELQTNDELYNSFPELLEGDISQLVELASVISIGHPFGGNWQPSVNRILRLSCEDDLQKLTITKTAIDRGCSGGPIFDEQKDLIGVIIEIDSIGACAVRIDVALNLLKIWGIPTNLIMPSNTPTPTPTPTPIPTPTPTPVITISTSRNDFHDYTVFHTSKIYLNLKVKQPIERLWVDWGENDGQFGEITDLQDLQGKEGEWYIYSIGHRYQSLKEKVIEIRVILEDGNEYQTTKEITINVLD